MQKRGGKSASRLIRCDGQGATFKRRLTWVEVSEGIRMGFPQNRLRRIKPKGDSLPVRAQQNLDDELMKLKAGGETAARRAAEWKESALMRAEKGRV